MIDALYDRFKDWCKNGSIYIISDTHFDDDDCIKMSPNWISPEEHLAIINKTVHKCDTLIHLGDVGNVEYIKQIKGYKVLLMGNHDTGVTNFKRKVTKVIYDQDKFTRDEAIADMKKKFPDCKVWAVEDHDFHSPFMRWNVYADNCLFDEVFEGPLMISEKILLSHEPIMGIDWALNIHGHDHSGRTSDAYHLNLASNVTGFTLISLGEYLKKHGVSKIKSLHRDTIDNATKRKQKRGGKR
jgi:calcineurin-like phosphoesterase family protein